LIERAAHARFSISGFSAGSAQSFGQTDPPIVTDGRLPRWLSVMVIVFLAAFCWAVLIAIVMACR